ncbi:MAG: amidase family protein, partial [Rubrobacter sp.]
ISVAGVNPVAPSFDTVGIIASSAEVLSRVASTLLAHDHAQDEEPAKVYLLEEAFSVADPDVRRALDEPIRHLRDLFGGRLRDTSVGEIDGEPGTSEGTELRTWHDAFGVVQWAEIGSSLDAWIEEKQPSFGPEAAQNFALVRDLDRRRVGPAIRRREDYFGKLKAFLGPNDLLCMPTAPALAPLKNTVGPRGSATAGDYYPRTLSLTSVAGIGRLPQASLPLASSRGVPVGLSLLAAHGRDAFLLGAGETVAASLMPEAS